MKQLRALALLALALLIAACSGGGSSQQSNAPGGVGTAPPDPEVAVELPESAINQMKALTAEKAARTPAQRKISSQLLYAKSNKFAALQKPLRKGETAKPNELRSLMQFDDRGRVLCDVKGDVDAGLASQIEIAGGTVVVTSSAHRSARAWLPLETLDALAEKQIVTAIRPAFSARTNRAEAPFAAAKFPRMTQEQRTAAVQKAMRALQDAPASNALAPVVRNAGSVTSEGSKAHAADRARKFYNTDGTGVKVGILSDSDDFKEASIASGDLPADTVTVPGQDGRPGSGEGTAMMEIVHDVAPGAKIFFASAFNSAESFADNIRTLRFVYHCDIIADDVQYYFESPYQDDIVAAAIADVRADGALYFSSAGNGGNFDDGTSGTFEGDFKSAGALATISEFGAGLDAPKFYRVMDFGKKVVSNRIELIGGPVVLHWADPGSLDNPLSSNDYDVFILSADLREVLVASTDIQDGDDLPFEFLGFLVPSELRIVVAATPTAQVRAVRLQIFDGELGIGTGGSVGGHAGSASTFAVGAVDAASADGGEFTAGPLTPVEIFSSDGNRMHFYDRDGNKIGSGNPTFAGSAGVTIKKPDASAADGVTTTLPSFSGLNPFFGTSAAAPHAAAFAALIKAAVPTADASKIASSLKGGALDIEASDGFDVDSGEGVISAMNGLQRAGAKPNVFLDLGTVTATPTSGTIIKPGSNATLSVQLTNNGGATASAVSATLSSSTPGVTITTANSAYPTIPAGQSRSNTTPFAFSLSSAAVCGLKVDFTVSVTFTGLGTKPTVRQFSVQTGGAGAAVLTSYSGAAVPIPDDDTAGADIPLTVAGVGLLNALSFRIDGTTCSTNIGSTTVGIDHTWVGDLRLRLISPSGTAVDVINRAGGSLNSGNNFCQTVLRDGAANSIQTVAVADAPYTGTFAPANPQNVFAGENADGTWILNVTDNALFDTGTVRAFSLETTGFSCTP
jgi:subtilisin-like proprotein convertase family protein